MNFSNYYALRQCIHFEFIGAMIVKMKYQIYKHIGNISAPNNGWIKELNFISWNDREPVYDIRTWTLDHSEYGKGVTITQGEMKKLQALINDLSVFM